MREADPQLTQQLITEVGLPAIARELSKSPEKRESLCEIIYCYTQEDTLNHLLALRSLKALVGDNLPVYISCLASFVTSDAQLGLLDEHLLDLYIYYALSILGFRFEAYKTARVGYEKMQQLKKIGRASCRERV